MPGENVDRIKVLVLLNFPEAIRDVYVSRLRAAFPELDFVSADHHSKVDPDIGDAQILLTFGAHMSDAVLEKGRRLRWIQVLGTGTDGVTDRPALRPGVLVTSLHGLQGKSVSEAVLASMLALARDLPRTLRNQAAARWERFPVALLHGSTVGVIGVGVIAEELAPRCEALGMRVVGITSTVRTVPGFDEMRPRGALPEAVADVDHLVILASLTDATRGLVDAKVLAAMKRSAFLINVARGGVVDEPALIAALQAGRIAGAALDVFAEEPLPAAHPFYAMPNVIVTPHVAGFHERYPDDALPVVEENIRRFLRGDVDRMINVVAR